LKIEWTRFTKSFASKRAAKFGIFALVFGTTLLLPLDSAGAAVASNVQVVCATVQGDQRTFTISWDNSQPFFQGKGQISRLYCEGGYAGNYKVFISSNLNDSTLDYYQGTAPVLTAPSASESQTSTVDSPTASEQPVPQPTETVTAQTPPDTSTNESDPTSTDSPTVSQSESQTLQIDSPAATVDSPTATVDSQPSNNQDSQTAQIAPTPSDSSTATEPVPPSLPIPDSSLPVQVPEIVIVPVQPLEPSSPIEPLPTPEPSAEEPNVEVTPQPEPEAETLEPVVDPVQIDIPSDPIPIVEPETPSQSEQAEPEFVEQNQSQESENSPIVESPYTAPISINTVDIATLAPNTPVQLENGVILTAEVIVALILLENPSELLGAIFSDPGQALMALANVGADMSPEVREQAQNTVLASIIAGGIATQSAVSAAGAAAYRRNP
jgi:hypothetical protein